jgi:hypothetical protein
MGGSMMKNSMLASQMMYSMVVNQFNNYAGTDLQFVSNCLPDFEPVADFDSNIITSPGKKLIQIHLPAMFKLQEWKLLHSIDQHGTDMRTFYNNVSENDETILLIQTDEDEIIGAYMTDTWFRSPLSKFYGSGDSSFVFDLVRDERKELTDINVYDPTFLNSKF